MELVWEDPPVPDAPFFTRDLYDKYSLGPNIRELWTFLQSPEETINSKQECGVEAANPRSFPSTEEDAAFEARSCITKEESCWDSCESDNPCADKGAQDCKDAKRSKRKLKYEGSTDFPEPRIPFPCLSSLSDKQQKTYLDFLRSKKTMDPPQVLQSRVNQEVMQFMMYLQDVSRICAQDYSFISQGAMQYTEDFFRSCLECIKTLPQLYKFDEMTSLTGGTFNPGLTLTFEKQLLTMGTVDITDHKIVPADAQLASDYQSVSSETPPAKKAKDMHATISSDRNAERLCTRYEPHVCLTRDALVRLLDNQGPEFGDKWELPVLVKLHPEKGKGQQKTVYIDSPLLKTEVTVRERSHFYHEESLKLSILKKGSTKVYHVMTELPVNEQQPSPETSKRNLLSVENNGLDFEVDLTDLETFGDTAPSKTPKVQTFQDEQDSCNKTDKAATSLPLSKTKSCNKLSGNASSSLEEEMNTSLANNDPIIKETTQTVGNESSVPKIEHPRQDTNQESDKDVHITGDSDDEKLVIDDTMSPSKTSTTHSEPEPRQNSADLPATPISECNSVNTKLLSPSKVAKSRRQSKRAKVSGDQLGEILRMQTAMFNSANEEAKSSNTPQETISPSNCTGPSVHSHTTSLVKPCVSSYLERSHNQDGEADSPQNRSAPVVNMNAKEHRKILSEDLQAGAEDEQDYEAPKEGNLFYKLYSLQDLLLMVRSSLSLSHTRKVGSDQNQHVPVHVLPKLEYQLSYGVECLSSSEACQLWTETALHSSTVSYIAHINAHTSKVALLRKLPDDWKQNISCGFKPSKSLNILHHLLKKLTRLEEGRYLIGHKAGEPFVTILKAANGKVRHEAYNLQQVHSSVPQPPASSTVPWIPVDPAVVMPFHLKHGRVPCTFPVKPFRKTTTTKDGTSQSNNRGAGSVNAGASMSTSKKKKKNRGANRNKYIKKLVHKSF